jgi:PDZ domain-containing secreted protein
MKTYKISVRVVMNGIYEVQASSEQSAHNKLWKADSLIPVVLKMLGHEMGVNIDVTDTTTLTD